MPARDGITLTPKQISQWREEESRLEKLRPDDEKLERELNQRNQRRNELRRRLEAVDLFAAVGEEILPDPAPLAPSEEETGDDNADSSAAVDFVANLRKTGDSLKVQQARQRLIDIGHAEEANRKNYIYGLLYRLVKSGKLVRRGSRYRAAPISSPQGETGAVGAPVVRN
jgi:hypothetical protein